MFEPARQSKTTDIIIERVRTAILDGTLRPGERLPTEKELGEQFQVSRQTMREALRALECLGLITVRTGSGGGAFIKAVDRRVAIQGLINYLSFTNMTVGDLSEMRCLLEPHAASCAAERISPEDLRALAAVNEETRAAIRRCDTRAITGSEIEFHRLIARQTGNPILMLIIDFIETLLEDFKALLKPDTSFMNGVLDAHEKIYDAILAADSKTAAGEMLAHVRAVDRHLAALRQDSEENRRWPGSPAAA